MNTIIDLTSREADFCQAYFEAIDFTEEDCYFDINSGLDKTFERESMIDCLSFYNRIACYLSDDRIEEAGQDFWFTRNGHGTGFWDNDDWGKYKAMFTARAEDYGQVDAVYNELLKEEA